MASVGIIGSGAIGLFVGSKLLDAEHEIHFLARSNFEALQQTGFQVDSKSGASEAAITRAYPSIQIYNDLSLMPKQDYVILCTTAADNSTYVAKLPTILNPNTVVISLQNGFNFEPEIYAAIKPHLMLSGTCWIKVSKRSPVHVRHDFGFRILLGAFPIELTRQPFTFEITNFRSIMCSAGFECEFLDNYLSAQLTKLAINLPFFGLMLRYQIKQAKVAKQHSDELLGLQREIIEIGKRLDVVIDEDYVTTINKQLAGMPEADLGADEKTRLAKEVKPNFASFFDFLEQKGMPISQLTSLYDELF